LRTKDNLLGILEASLTCGVEKADKVAAAHITHFVNSVVPTTTIQSKD